MNYETLKAAVANVIKTNGNEEITGQLLQDVLMAIINALGSGYQFMGIATAETTPGTPDQRVFYLAGSAGSTVLPGFGITVNHEICVLMYSDEWEKQTLLQFDSALTSGSQKLVTSGMVYDALINLSQAINGLAQTVGEHTTAIESLQGTVGDHTTAIEALQETVGGHTTAINNLQYAVVAIQAAIESLQTDVAQKIDKSDADSLVVGSAQGVLATSAVEAFFLFQQSGATGDGAALIPTIEGKTIAWNQLAPKRTTAVTPPEGITATLNNDGSITLNGTATATGYIPICELVSIKRTAGRKYYFGFGHRTLPAGVSCGFIGYGTGYWNGSFIYTFNEAATDWTTAMTISIASGTILNNFKVWPRLTDLTLAFGVGNEPSTVAEFETLYNKLYYSPVSGVLKNNDAVAMITDGFNQWDEEWLPGTYSTSDGETYTAQSGYLCSKNKISVFAGQTYYVKAPATFRFFLYDKSGVFFLTETRAGGSTIEIPSNAGFMRFQLAYSGAYSNDICVNLSNPDKNGTYEPYWTRKVNFGLDAIKVKSPNIWDEQWEKADIDNSGNVTTGTRVISKNFIPVLPSTNYYFYGTKAGETSGNLYISGFWYDDEHNFISSTGFMVNGVKTSPSNARYLKFKMATAVVTYNNDICINLSAPGINGKYFPYGEDGILTYNGLDGAGTAFDFIFKDANGIQKLQKTMVEVDLGEPDWREHDTKESFFQARVDSLKGASSSIAANCICAKYIAVGSQGYNNNTDKSVSVTESHYIQIFDSAYTDAAAFKAAMAGVKLIAEAANPAILELAEPIPDMFLTAQGGTMLIVSPEGATAPSAPFSADIVYPVDPIVSSGASLKNLLEALKTATVIASYTMTFNSTTQQYEFTIVK